MGGENVQIEKSNNNSSSSSSSSPSASGPPPTCFSHFWSSALRAKTLTAPSVRTNDGEGLLRRLGLFELVLIGVGASVGAGIFVVTGTVARDAGPGPLFACSIRWLSRIYLVHFSLSIIEFNSLSSIIRAIIPCTLKFKIVLHGTKIVSTDMAPIINCQLPGVQVVVETIEWMQL